MAGVAAAAPDLNNKLTEEFSPGYGMQKGTCRSCRFG